MESPSQQLARASRWPHRLAVITAAATLLLIFVGGLVTNTGSALAVPDWPTTFGYNMFLYPWSRMVGGIFYEHSHRLIGSAVGMLTVACALSVWWREQRTWVRRLGAGAVAAVIAQGVLGGLRVVLLQQQLAILHGCLAQAFFAVMVSLAVCTSQWWQTEPVLTAAVGSERLRTLAIITPALVYVQIAFGALLTHLGARLDAHLLFAGLVTVCVALLAGEILRRPAAPVALRRPALLLALLLVAQLCLGLGAYLGRFTSVRESMSPLLGLILPTTHRLTGTFVFGTSLLLALRIVRVLGVREAMAQPARAAETLAGMRPDRSQVPA
jgi:cytochrome c oxidase assembly protein subunit 15